MARAQGITIFEDPVLATLAVCESTSMNISSMLQDIRHQRPTEIEAINGAVSRMWQTAQCGNTRKRCS